MKSLKKVFFYLLITLLVLIAGSLLSVFLFKDKIIQQFVREANKKLNTPVKIGKIDISAFNDFPNLSIVFTDVYVEDSHPGNYPLLTADKISFNLSLIDVWKGNYSINGLSVLNSETNLKINAVGKNNFSIIKETNESEGGNVHFDLRKVNLTNTKVNYTDQQAIQHYIFKSEHLLSSIQVDDDRYTIEALGDVTTELISIKNSEFLTNKTFNLDARVIYDDNKKEVAFDHPVVTINDSKFDISGSYQFKEKNLIKLKAGGKDTDIQTIISLLPEGTTEKLKNYKSDGDVFFTLALEGELSEKVSPKIQITFGCINTKLYHPEYKSEIKHANLQGTFRSPSTSNFAKAELILKNVEGELNGKSFKANLSISEFNDPYIDFDFKGDLDAGSLNNFYPLPELYNLTGFLSADISFRGKTSLLKKKATVQQVKTNGSIVMSRVNFEYGNRKIKLKDINGTLQFNNHDLALSNVTGQLENSDFHLNGFFKNIITFLLFENQPIGIETDLKSDFLDLDQLFLIGFGEEHSKNYKFSISPDVQLNFNCDVSRMKYKRFYASKVKGDLLVKGQVAVSRNIMMNTMGGSLTFNGIVDAKNEKAIDLVSSFKLNGIQVDSVFYVFENFYQDFIQDKHLKGQAYADVDMEMVLNEQLHLIPSTLVSNIIVTIKNGELNNFEPMKKLNKYLDDDGLTRLRFADLKNDIHIENQTVYLPQMEVKTNVATIQISGTHTFDQRIDYRVVSPLRNKNKVDPDEAFGAVEDDGTGPPKIYLKIVGTTDIYEVSLDKDALKKKIAGDLKKEVKELKEAFKLKGQKKKKELELTTEEFDWDN